MMTVRDIVAAFHEWCPPSSAESYDNVGLQVGKPAGEVRRVLVALDLTPEVVTEALAKEVQMVVTHHPPIFNPLKSITADDYVGAMLLALAEARVAVFAAHTNLDAAKNGVSCVLATALGLDHISLLQPLANRSVKLSTFVPTEAVDAVHDAIAAAGGGRIGAYDACAFLTRGTGRFRPREGANPTVGSIGRLESVAEVRLEVEVERDHLPRVVAAMRSAHPYEEVAFDVVALETESRQRGMGMLGRLPVPMTLGDFVAHVSRSLRAEGVRYSGDPDRLVASVGVCGGSGSGLIPRAIAAGADAFVTGDISYHRFFECFRAGGAGMAIIDAGHYETEQPVEELILERMGRLLPAVEWVQTSVRTSPVRYHRP